MAKNNFENEIDYFDHCEGSKGHIPNIFGVGVLRKGRKRDISKKDYS